MSGAICSIEVVARLNALSKAVGVRRPAAVAKITVRRAGTWYVVRKLFAGQVCEARRGEVRLH